MILNCVCLNYSLDYIYILLFIKKMNVKSKDDIIV